MRLILMRHAKSDWSTSAGSDHTRPLNPRGETSARALGTWMRNQGYLPDQALVSSATRTQQTFLLLGLEHADASTVPELYHATPNILCDTLCAATGATVLMVGHNPGIAEFAALCVDRPPTHDRFRDYPTGATLVADFPGDSWADISLGAATVVDFVIPRELMASQ